MGSQGVTSDNPALFTDWIYVKHVMKLDNDHIAGVSIV